MQSKKKQQSYKNFNISEKLRSENKSNDFFEIMLNNLTIEELLALKFELAFKSIGFMLKGFPLIRATKEIVVESLLRVAVSANYSKNDAIAFLGVNRKQFYELIKKHNLEGYYGGNKNGERKE
jgi:hypothetical protein